MSHFDHHQRHKTYHQANNTFLNNKMNYIQNHIDNLYIDITDLPEPWKYAVTDDGRIFFIKYCCCCCFFVYFKLIIINSFSQLYFMLYKSDYEKTTTWLHPKTRQPVSTMIVPSLEGIFLPSFFFFYKIKKER
jgi:hypothetical protein